MSEEDEVNDKVSNGPEVSEKLLEATTFSGFKDRSKRRMSLPLSGSLRDSRKGSLIGGGGPGGAGPGGSTSGSRRGSVDKAGGSRRTSSASGSDGSWSSYDSDFSDEDLPPPRERAHVNSKGFTDFCIKNISNHTFGRREIELAEQEMPAVMSLRNNAKADQPLRNAKIAMCTHINAQTAVMIETLVALGAKVRVAACNIFSTQNEVAAALAEAGISVYAWRGQMEEDFWWCLKQCFAGAENFQADLLFDDGGDMTQMAVSSYPARAKQLKGIVEESVTGVHRLYFLLKNHRLSAPAMNLHDSVTKGMFENYFWQREALIDALKRCTDTMLAGKKALVVGYGQVGKGCCVALKRVGCDVVVAEVDPICALFASMEGIRVKRVENAIRNADIVITATGNKNVILREHMEKMKDGCILANMGHANTEIDVTSIKTHDIVWERIRSNVDHIIFPNKKRIILLAEGRLLNLAVTSIPSLVVSINSCSQILALIEMFNSPINKYKNEVYLLPRKIDEYVASLHLPVFGANLSQLSDEQAKYIGLNKFGPYKPLHYRY